MNKSDRLEELQRQEAEERRAWDKEVAANPLIQYSTTQLKAELRRRKGVKNME